MRRLLTIFMVLGLAAVIVFPSPAEGAAQNQTPTASQPCGLSTDPPETFDHVVLVIFENKSYDRLFKKGNAPYLQRLANRCGRAKAMSQVSGASSLANYIALTSGYDGYPTPITSNRGPTTYPQDTVSLFELLGDDWRSYSENALGNCWAGNNFDFTVNHSPAPYYTRIADSCLENNVPMPRRPDLGASFTLLTPNNRNIMHEDDAPGTTTNQERMLAGDEWASEYMRRVLNSPEYAAGNMVVIITFDEGTKIDPIIPFIIVSPYTPKRYRTRVPMDHYSTLKGIQEMLDLEPLLGNAADPDTVSIRDYFGLSAPG